MLRLILHFKCADYISVVALADRDELILVGQFRPAVDREHSGALILRRQRQLAS